jgi:hypothetical protein
MGWVVRGLDRDRAGAERMEGVLSAFAKIFVASPKNLVDKCGGSDVMS